MELRHLRYFTALAETLSFTRAAERVHVTQSTLSHQIRQLEDEVGRPLFERLGKRVVLTEDGELFVACAENALREVDHGLGLLRETRSEASGDIRIAATHTFNLRFIPECVAAFLQRYPTVTVHVEEASAEAVLDGLQQRRIDVGVAYRPDHAEDLWFEPLYNEEMVLVVGPTHPFARRRRVRMVELHRQRLVLLPRQFATRTLLEECFRACSAEPTVVAEMNTIAAMLGLVERTQIATIVAKNAVPPGGPAVVVPIESPTPMRTPGLLWLRSAEHSAPIRHFAGIVRRTALRQSLEAWPPGAGMSTSTPATGILNRPASTKTRFSSL